MRDSNTARIKFPARESVATADIPGVVCLVWRRGELLAVDAEGLRDIEAGLPMERDTIFRIASMSKPVTTTAALILMERGVMRLEDPITQWAPEFADMRVLRRADGPLTDTYPAPRVITVEDLMTHRSGLSYSFTATGPLSPALGEKFGFEIDATYTPDAWMKMLASFPLSFAPGERFRYGYSTDVLGYVVARAMGVPLRDAMHELVFDPLGMIDTDFWIPPPKRGRAAVLYRSGAPGQFTRVDLPGFMDDTPPQHTAGGYGLVSTVDDYLNFARMLLQGGDFNGRRILKEETIRMMTTNRLTPAQRKYPQFGLPFFMAQGFGLGVSIIDDPKKHGWMGTGNRGTFGWPGLFGGWWQADPEEQMVMLWLQQTLPTQAPAGGGAAAPRDSKSRQALMRWVFGSPPLMSMLKKLAQRSGKGPRLPGMVGTQKFQTETYAALKP
jgi:CubicO group peptidase (beta-lactamase class C family)